VSGLPPLPGHPGAVRLLADRLASTATRLAALASVLARLRDGATWDGPAGEAFGARLREVGPVLEAVSERVGGAAPPLRSLAGVMEEAQGVVARAVLEVDEAQHAYAGLEDRAAALVAGGAGADDAGMLLRRHLQLEQVEAEQLARARHLAAAERFHEADRRCAAVLRSLSVDGLADSVPYRVLVGASTVGHDVATLAPAATVLPELAPVVSVADALAVAADATLFVAYDEGDGGALARSAALSGLGAAGGVLRAGATAGAERTAAGVVSTARLTGQQRLALGVVHEVRRRRDALRASFHVPPARGTPSALVGGPPVRAVGGGGGAGGSGLGSGLSVPAVLERARTGAQRAAARARTAAVARVDKAFLDDWRLATANGPQAERMYTAGVTLETAAAGARKTASPEQGGGGNVR
jgi:hypothetical protein